MYIYNRIYNRYIHSKYIKYIVNYISYIYVYIKYLE